MTVQTVTFHSELINIMLNLMSLTSDSARELYIHEDIFLVVKLVNIIKKADMYEDLSFEDNNNNNNDKAYEND